MGVGRSKSFPISYEEACKRVDGSVLQRLQDTFKRFGTVSGYLPQVTFVRDVLGDSVPVKLAETVYESFGGGPKGIGYKDLVCGLVLLVRGSKQEKAHFIGHLVCGEGEKVTRERLDQLVIACDNSPPQVNLDTLFKEGTTASLDHFETWILDHPQLASFSMWLLSNSDGGCGLRLEGDPDPPSFHQTLAGRFGLDEQVVMDVERTYWSLKGASGKFDQTTLESFVCPPLPIDLCADLFRVMDLNLDGHIDLTEMLQMVAKICRGSGDDPHKFCFTMFDRDQDELLSRAELVTALTLLQQIKESNRPHDDQSLIEEVLAEELASQALDTYSKDKEGHLTAGEYFSFMSQCDLGAHLIKVLIEICHVRFGLRPSNPELEGLVVNSYLNRFHKSGRCRGNTVYIIPNDWFTQWKVYTSQEEEVPVKPKKQKRKSKSRSKSQQLTLPTHTSSARSHSMPADVMELNSIGLTATGSEAPVPQRPEAIDNSVLCVSEQTGSKKLPSLTNEGGRLVRGRVLMEGKDYVVLPEVIWRVFVTWYSSGGYTPGLALPRIVGPDGSVDLYPIVFKLYRHTTNPAPAKSSNLPWPIASLLSSVGILSSQPPSVSGPLLSGDESAQTPQPRRVPYYQAAFPKSSTLAEVSEVIQMVLRVKAEDLRLYTYSSDDPVLLEDERASLEQLGLNDGDKLLIETRNKDNSWPEEIIAIMKEVIVKDKDKPKVTQGSEVRVPQGATGLSNLGNTCFMNSALQCVSNTRPLTMYFREKDHLSEINKDNPLGTGGVLAKRYGELIDDLWTGSSKSITPLKFRFTVGRYAPQFNGFQQQDCQELLAFLLDGLHEDLNRVKEKAYRELDDSDGRADDVVAKEAWDYHLSRNQSIIVDLFQGQLKSVVTCKVCQYTSVRFDPFTFLSLPLPMESTVNLEVIVIRLDGTQPMRYGLKLELDDKYRQLKKALSEVCGLEQSAMLLVEVYSGLVRSLPSDSTKIRSILGGWLYAYEIPPARSVAPTSRADSPDEVLRQQKMAEVRRERAMSLHSREEELKRAKLAQANFKSHDTSAESHDMDTEAPSEDQAMDTIPSGSHDKEPESHDMVTKPPEHSPTDTEPGLLEITVEAPKEDTDASQEVAKEKSEVAGRSPDPVSGSHEPMSTGLEGCDGFVFAIHRRMYSVEHYFVSSQKSRPVIFGTPLVVPCDGITSRQSLYECAWRQVQRLMIPDPPNKTKSPEHDHYPFKLKLVAKDGLTCGQCPWYSFCNGCEVPCDGGTLGKTSGYIAVDWDSTTLHLKYQSAQERPLEHESMESLKVIDTKPIDLYECFKAFVRQDELGDEESWYCKRCKTHREAIKSLEIWKLPPVLIIHLKRFQFFNGRWVKSQRDVTFPILNLDPTRHTAHNSNGQGGDKGKSCDQTEQSHDQPSDPTEQSHDQTDESHDQPSDEAEQSCDQTEQSCDNGDINASEGPQLYDLFAICCHSGVMGGGHYVSFARNPNNMWYYFNDSSCKETNEERVLEESPYLLFYETKGLQEDYNKFRVQRSGGKGQDVGAEDDLAFEETLKNLRKSCSIQ